MQDIRLFIAALALARILAGETPGCTVATKIAVANVAMNRTEAGIRGGWFGDADPTAADVAVAWLAVRGQLPRLTDAIYAIGPGDKARMAWLAGEQAELRFVCKGTFVEVYR